MKKITKYVSAIAAIVVALSGCQKEMAVENIENSQEEGINLTLVADNQPENLTKTQMNLEQTDVIWSKDEYYNFYKDGEFIFHGNKPTDFNVTQTISSDGKTITFHLKNIPADTKQLSGFFGAKYCSEAQDFVSGTSGQINGYGITLPSEQKISSSSFDPLCDALVMKPVDISIAHEKSIKMQYKRLFAITKLTFKGLENHYSEIVSSVKFETSQTDIAGGVTCNIQSQNLTTKDGQELTGSLFTSIPSKAITMSYAKPVKLDEKFAAWMVAAPVKFAEGETVTITITTDKAIITKKINIPTGASLDSTCGNGLNIDMTGCDQAVSKDLSGDYVIAVKEGNRYVAMCAELDLNSSTSRMQCQPIDYSDGSFTRKYIASDKKFIWTLAKQASPANTYYISAQAGGKTQYLNGGNSVKRNSADFGDNGTAIRIEESTKTPGTYHISTTVGTTEKHLKKFADNPYFAFYKDAMDICLIPAELTNKTQLKTPVVVAEGNQEGNAITVLWDAVEGATSYVVNCSMNETITQTKTVTPTSETTYMHTFTGLAYGTYSITVKAVGSENTIPSETTSDPATIILKDPNAAPDPEVTETLTFGEHADFSTWGTSYRKITLDYANAAVEFESANKQSQTIKDQPVTKGQPVTITMKNGKTLKKVSFQFKQWKTISQTATLHYSTDGQNFQELTPSVTSDTFAIPETVLPENTTAVKITFSNNKKQIGITSATITY